MDRFYKKTNWLLLLLLVLFPKAKFCEEIDLSSTSEELEGKKDPELTRGRDAETKVEYGDDDDDDDFYHTQPTGPPDDFKTVEVEEGLVKGILEKSTNGKYFYGFYGIPYAKPPLGELRFKDPEYHDGWIGVHDATKMPPGCPQIDINKFVATDKISYSGNEDCLFLNVFQPAEFDGIPKPVLVYIHGGAFVSGAASDYEPYDFMNENVILVVIQYRLGILGFASTEDLVIPGNLGIKDQTRALRWIQNNIDVFGGNPLKVALFGQGSGAASVHYQILSHHTIGLFSKAILQSGTAICPWAQGGVHRKAAISLAKTFKCFEKNVESGSSSEASVENEEKTTEDFDIFETEDSEESIEESSEGKETSEESSDELKEEKTEEEILEEKTRESEEILECLKDIDVKKLTKAIKPFYALTYFPMLFGPLMDERWIPDNPAFLLKEARHKRLEMIIGVARDPASYITNSIFASEGKRLMFKYDFNFAAPLSMEYTDNDIAPLNMSIKAFDHYVGGLRFDAADAYNITKLFSDRHFTVCSDLTAFFHQENNIKKEKAVFFYELQHRGARSRNDIFSLSFGKEWIAQGDELFYMFPMKSHDSGATSAEIEEEDKKLKELVIKMWVNFAEEGDPTPDDALGFIWEPFTTEVPSHLVLKPEPYMEEDTRNKVREFWTSLPTEQNMLLYRERIKNLKRWNGTEEIEEETVKEDTKNDEESLDKQETTEEMNSKDTERAEEQEEQSKIHNDEL